MGTKHKGSDAGNSDMTEGSHVLLPVNEKRNVLDLIRKEKKLYVEVAKIYSKNLLSLKLWGRKKKFVLILFSYLRLQKL